MNKDVVTCSFVQLCGCIVAVTINTTYRPVAVVHVGADAGAVLHLQA